VAENLTDTKALTRRIKTHVVGPQHRFLVAVPPELTPICLKEISGLDIQGPETVDAGVEFSGKLKDAYICNLWLRTAGRVLCRLTPFRAGTAEELFHKSSRIPWELWLDPDLALDIETQVEYSRIRHEGRVAEVISGSIEKRLRDSKPARFADSRTQGNLRACTVEGVLQSDEAGLNQKILVRLIENHCRISLDTSGPHLHRRGYRLHHTGAPLRETLAAAIIFKSEWRGNEPLVDGMCGSGTFPVEAALIARKFAPGLGRGFLFQRWPSFQKETWEYLCRKAKETCLLKTPVRILGIDIDPGAIGVAAENANRAGVGGDVEWDRMDFFEFKPGKIGLGNGLLVLNPPYGIRLGSGGISLYERIGAHLRLYFKGWKYAILAGSRAEAAAMGTGRLRLWNIRHGGIPVTVAFGRVTG
jgi:23S rRNA G2445 N2-methylase RlmL